MRSDHTPVEVEVKITVHGPEDTRRRLEECGFFYAGTYREEDVYYNSVHYDLREHDKALRIRRVTDLDTGKTHAEFNCKGPKLDQVEGLGDYLELEIIGTGEEQRESCLEEIEAVMKEVGYEQKDTIRTSYLSLLQKK